MKAIITPATFSPVKLSRVLHALSRVGQLHVNEHGELFGNYDEAITCPQDGRKEISGEQFYGYLGLETLGPVKELGWKDGAFTYKGFPVIEVGGVQQVEDEFINGTPVATFDADQVVSQLLNLEGQEEKNMENIRNAVQRSRGLNLIMHSLAFKLFNLVKIRELHIPDPNVSMEERARILTERNNEVEDLRVKSMAAIANNMASYVLVDGSNEFEFRQARAALRAARTLNNLSLAEAPSHIDYSFYYKEDDAAREESYKMTELLELGMPVSV